jgi:diadenosine tetraphosphate (Ap4A) HIT family hydrolase
MTFKLNSKIEENTYYLTRFQLSECRLLEDGDNEWFVLIPRVDHLVDWDDLSPSMQRELNHEISTLTGLLKMHTQCDKVNVANLGNIVQQFHVHVIARYKSDRAWPGSIWGTKSKTVFQRSKLTKWRELIKQTKL